MSQGTMTDFSRTRSLFDLPAGVIYLDGNSLGPLPSAALTRAQQVMRDEWGAMLIGGWNKAGWMELAARVGDRIGRLIGAAPGSVTMGETLSLKLYQALASAMMLTDRRVILSDNGNFPSDLYMAQGLVQMLNRDAARPWQLVVVDPEAVAGRIGPDVGILMLTEVDYRTGRKHDMAALTKAAHAVGAITIWDLAHSAGAIPVDLTGTGADFAVGCTYKYLNGGPGAPAFIYVAPQLQARVVPALSGWLGHEAPFAFDLNYRPALGVGRMRIGTPPVLALSVLDAALEAWEGVDMIALRRESQWMGNRFAQLVTEGAPELRLVSPADAEQRGSQVSFAHPGGYAMVQALIAEGVVGDFRAPDVLRFGFTPLYLSRAEVEEAARRLVDIVRSGRWDQPRFHRRHAVT